MKSSVFSQVRQTPLRFIFEFCASTLETSYTYRYEILENLKKFRLSFSENMLNQYNQNK